MEGHLPSLGTWQLVTVSPFLKPLLLNLFWQSGKEVHWFLFQPLLLFWCSSYCFTVSSTLGVSELQLHPHPHPLLIFTLLFAFLSVFSFHWIQQQNEPPYLFRYCPEFSSNLKRFPLDILDHRQSQCPKATVAADSWFLLSAQSRSCGTSGLREDQLAEHRGPGWPAECLHYRAA